MSTSWSGVFPAVTTKFKEDLSLDFAAMEHHLRYLIDAGVHGLIVTGTLGENGSLTADEKQDVLTLAVAISGGRVPVLAGVAERTTAAACRAVVWGNKNGADGFMVLPPLQYLDSHQETMTFFREVAATSERPLMLYNNPSATRFDITPEVLVELADDPKFVAIKESSEDIRRIMGIKTALGDRYQVFIGVDDLALEALVLGIEGWVAGLTCAFPMESLALFNLIQVGRLEEARALYRWFLPLLRLDASPRLVQNVKLSEARMGLGNERVRPPRQPLAGAEREAVVAILDHALATRPPLML